MEEEIQTEQEKTTYKAAVEALFQNEIESDKILLGVSSGAMGLLATLLQHSEYEFLILFILSSLCFLSFGITILCIIKSLLNNKKQILQIIKDNGKMKEIPELERFNRYKYFSFSVGLLLFSLFFMISFILSEIN